MENYRFMVLAGALGLMAVGSIEVCGIEPPNDLKIEMPAETEIIKRPKELEDRIFKEIAERNDQADKYAVLINGSNENLYLADISLVYQILLENQFKKENIYILDESGTEEFSYPADGIATKENIENLFSYLSEKIDEQDSLVVHISDHGIRTMVTSPKPPFFEMITEVSLPVENISEVDLEKYLSEIKPKFGLITTDICYGGGIAYRLGKGNYVGISSTTADMPSYSGLKNSFGGFFYLAFRDSANSDFNKDGRVTLNEAFDYAKSRHYSTLIRIVSPQLFSEMDVTDISIK